MAVSRRFAEFTGKRSATMNEYITQVSATARQAVFKRNWPTVSACAREILKHDELSPEGYFLAGLVAKAAARGDEAMRSFETALDLDSRRHDAAIELAFMMGAARRFGDATALVSKYEHKLGKSPLYLNMAATVYSSAGMHARALPLFEKANELQPGVDMFQNSLATCYVTLGKIDEARAVYNELKSRFPKHQRYHYQLARLAKAKDRSHVDEMIAVLQQTNQPADKNIFMYYAIGKELEDLEEWDEAFEYFEKAGNAVMSVADYDSDSDLELIDTIIECCSADWVADGASEKARDKTPIFVIGLPRTGTTLTERIVSSHSTVASVGETQFMQMVIRRESGIQSDEKMTPEIIQAGVNLDIDVIGDGYMDMLSYRLGEEPMFIDKLPFNIFYLGFIAKAFPGSRIVLMGRNPMDSCFSMYKQVFTWAYKFSYSLEGLGRFYPAYRRLVEHWRAILGDRLIEIDYEALVADQENQIRMLLDRLGLEFEQACLEFEKNPAASGTASSVQVRQKIHRGSVDRWKRYEQQLGPLRKMLEAAGIAVE